LNTFFKKNNENSVERITKILYKWYFLNKRDLPWRKTTSAYKVWLSEIILQQTRVNQGLQYYNRFLERFPDIYKLAQASLEEVLKAWQGLGYYTRARNLHATAGIIVKQFNGQFPADYNTLLSLKGIGEYTAAAIASIAFDIPVALVDGNVFRVLSRLYGIRLPNTSPAGKKEIYRLATSILNNKNPGNHNQALMELGALVCLPKNPACADCPLQSLCWAFQKDQVDELPVKAVISHNKKRYFHYLHISWSDKLFIHQRKQKDIWNSLFEFPLIETRGTVKPEKLFMHDQWKHLFNGSHYSVRHISPFYIHQLTHQTLYVRFYRVQIKVVPPALAEGYICTDEKKIFDYPVSRLTERYLTSCINR
jgi:A/G-specific adenine glycosylase